MRRKLILFCVIIAMSCHALEFLDVETLPILRTKQYSMGSHRKVVIFSAPRTGSTLVYNIFRFLFEDHKNFSQSHNVFSQNNLVLKTHRFNQPKTLRGNNILYVVPIRDPLETSISTYRIRAQLPANLQNWCKWVVHNQVNHLVYAEKRKEAGHDVLFIKYEDFEGNLDYLIRFIENYFSISISDFDKNTMLVGYSRENVYHNIHGLADFREYLPISGFHGKHVVSEKFPPPDDVLYWLNQYLQEESSLFQKYGYLIYFD
jgi:hypothetical protein